ncbi:hypothetical protein [Aerococcus urinaeequi]|uniref:DUF3021 domain-containing protein n=1 Tax=Aerococcus urinaeequi TaxID=51665 RepID=A0A7M1KTD8_9LACT|nr:hypothetical protein [Aerococcus urinaeequi]QOQ79533.1 hypothetical protein IMX20_02200 [Aerococcus urinaeequi]
MKNFFNYNLANMTYIYSVLVLLSAISSAIGTENKNISSLDLILMAVLVLLMTIIANIVATIDFKTTIQYHLANISAQLGGLILLQVIFTPKPINVIPLLGNIMVFLLIYLSVYKIHKNRMEFLATEINRKLGYKK